MSYLPTVAWTTIVNDVVLLTPTTYRVTVSPLDINEPGAPVMDLQVGYYLKDYIGVSYNITAINVGGNPNHIEVTDSLGVGYGPQTGQFGYIYKSVGDGRSPFLAPIRHRRLDLSALDMSREVELDVIWKNLLNLDQTSTQTIVNGIPLLEAGRVIDLPHELVDKVYADTVLHNGLSGLQGGSSGQYYHLTSAEYTGSGTGVFARVQDPTFTATTGTKPFTVGSTTLVNNLNADLLDGLDSTYFLPQYFATDIHRLGFTSPYDSTISFDGVNLFTIAPTATTWSYWRQGFRRTITGSKTVTVASPMVDNTMYFIYIDANDGTLISSTISWDLLDDKIPVATLFWNNTQTPKYFLGEERHTVLIDERMHYYEHFNEGTKMQILGAITGYTLNSSVDTGKTFAIANSIINDEDIIHSIPGIPDPNGITLAYNVIYRTGATTRNWKTSNMPFVYNVGNANNAIQYDNGGTMTDATNNRLVNTYVCFANVQGSWAIFIIPGRAEFATLVQAQAEDPATFNLDGFISTELVIAYQLTWTNQAAGGTGNCKLVADPKRVSTNLIQSSGTAVGFSHNTLSGLQGGILGEYYHLSSAQYTIATQAATSSLSGYLTSTDWNTFNGKINLTSLSSSATGLTYTNTTGVFSLTSGYVIPTTTEEANWNSAYGVMHNAVTLATNSGLQISTQVLNMGTPSTITLATTNSVTTNTHTHALTGVSPTIHNLVDTTNHPVSGLTTGHFMKALSPTTYGFAAHGLLYSDVGASPATGGTGYIQNQSVGAQTASMWINGTGQFGSTVTASGGNSTNWNSAYTYSQVGHLPLSGGTLTGDLNIVPSASNTYALLNLKGNSRGGEIDFYNGVTVQSSIAGGVGTKDLRFYVNGYDLAGTIASDKSMSFVSTISAAGGNSTQWNTAYSYSQVGHLPLAGGTLTGDLYISKANSYLYLNRPDNTSETGISLGTGGGHYWYHGLFSGTDILHWYHDGDKMTLDGLGNATFAGSVTVSQYLITPNGTNALYNIVNSDNTYAGKYIIQAGGGSGGYGGAINLYGHSHASKPGDVAIGISEGSNGKFRVNTSGLDGGSDVFTVTSAGNATLTGTSTTPLTITSTTHNFIDIRAASSSQVAGFYLREGATAKWEFGKENGTSDYYVYSYGSSTYPFRLNYSTGNATFAGNVNLNVPSGGNVILKRTNDATHADGNIIWKSSNDTEYWRIGVGNSDYGMEILEQGASRFKIAVGGNATFAGSVTSPWLYSSNSPSNSISVGNTNSNYSFVSYSGYWGLRQSTDNAFNLDTYNGGTPINALKITQAGNATFAGDINIGANAINMSTISALGLSWDQKVQGSSTIGSLFYSLTCTRSAFSSGNNNRPDITGLSSTSGTPNAYGLRIGRSSFITDIIVGNSDIYDTANDATSAGNGTPRTPYIKFNGFGSGLLFHDSTNGLSVSSYTTSTGKLGYAMINYNVDPGSGNRLMVNGNTYLGGDIVQVGDYNSSTGKITCSGDITSVNGDGVFSSTVYPSDMTLKENIVEMNSSKFKDIKFYSFNFKNNPGVPRYGAMAQEVEIYAPELVKIKNGIKVINYIDLLIAKVAELESRLNIAESKIPK
jgi:hypothetical protein